MYYELVKKKIRGNPFSSFGPRWYIFLFALILGFSLVSRLINLDRIPQGVSSDILLFFSHARAIAETGKDIYGKFLPIFFDHKGILLSPVAVYAIAFFYKIFGFSFVTGYFPNIIASVISIAFGGLIAFKLTESRRIALFTAIILSISPWHYHLSRTAFEGVLAFTFILVGIYFSILALKNTKYFIVTFFLFALAAYTYKAVNVFLILYPIIFWLTLAKDKVKKIHLILFATATLLIVFSQWFSLFVFYKDTYATGYVQNNIAEAKIKSDEERLMSDAPYRLRLLTSNALFTMSQTQVANYLHFFSPQYLLTTGDNDLRFSTGRGGQFYILDALLFVFGIWYFIHKKKNKPLLFLLSIIFAAPVAALISDEAYAVRTFITVFAFAIIIAAGAEKIVEREFTFKFKRVIIAGLFLIYAISALLYFYRYHYLYIHYGREAWNGVNNDIFPESFRMKDQYKRIGFGGSGEYDYLTFMYWNKLPSSEIQKELTSYGGKNLNYGNIEFLKTCSFDGDEIRKNSIKENQFLFTRDYCIKNIPPIKQYYLPKTLIWQWKTYDSVRINEFYNQNPL